MPEVLKLFTELAAIPSPSGEGRAVADVVAAYLRDWALDVDADDTGAAIGSSAGNLYARVEPTAPGTPIFLCAHLDTVPPTGRIEPVVDDEGIVRNAAGTILGADDKSAIAVMLEATRRVLSERRPHAGIELLFTPKAEVGLIGGGAVARRAEADGSRPGDARLVLLRRRCRRLPRRRRVPQVVRRLSLQARGRGRAARGHGAPEQ